MMMSLLKSFLLLAMTQGPGTFDLNGLAEQLLWPAARLCID
jgi:hypothetical protein